MGLMQGLQLLSVVVGLSGYEPAHLENGGYTVQTVQAISIEQIDRDNEVYTDGGVSDPSSD